MDINNMEEQGRDMKYRRHAFVCTNQKAEGKKCCGETHGKALVAMFKDKLKEANLHHEIRIQAAGCLDVCKQGPGMVIYPEGIFYGNVQQEDVDEIFNSHIVNGQVVQRLKLSF